MALPKLCSLALASCALLVAACGGSSAATSSQAALHRPSIQALAKCMRSHGVPNFPDPTGAGGRPQFRISILPGSSGVVVNSVTLNGPAFQAAQRKCRSYLPGGAPPTKRSAA